MAIAKNLIQRGRRVHRSGIVSTTARLTLVSDKICEHRSYSYTLPLGIREESSAAISNGNQAEMEPEEADDEGEAVDLRAVAKFSYVATEEDELSFVKGQHIHLVWRDSWDEATKVLHRLPAITKNRHKQD